MRFIGGFLGTFFLGSLALAQAASPSPVDPSATVDFNGLFSKIAEALVSGKKVAAAAGLVLLLVYLFRQYALPKLNLGSGILPYVSLASGLLIGLLSNLVAGIPVQEAANISLLSGPVASQVWSGFFKLMAKKDVG